MPLNSIISDSDSSLSDVSDSDEDLDNSNDGTSAEENDDSGSDALVNHAADDSEMDASSAGHDDDDDTDDDDDGPVRRRVPQVPRREVARVTRAEQRRQRLIRMEAEGQRTRPDIPSSDSDEEADEEEEEDSRGGGGGGGDDNDDDDDGDDGHSDAPEVSADSGDPVFENDIARSRRAPSMRVASFMDFSKRFLVICSHHEVSKVKKILYHKL